MSVKVIVGCNDEEWDIVSNTFYNNFNPDDWDYIIVGKSEQEVDDMSYKLEVSYREIKKLGDSFWAVTYHS